ncbi:hypothetical protein MKY41_03255 [Sporosarcina sp. FSL W7-1349]|uniref:hypothetical protein n=1 Tax=Sporosarcina sp. FSL W7-1349 TaxID=2921561 RepID=UPI0030FD0C2E
MYLELVNNALSTMLLDSIGHYHKSKKQKECFGIVFGDIGENFTGEYTFPVGNVVKKTSTSVQANEEVNGVIADAKKLVSMSEVVAYYHSHPYEEMFDNWADPSLADLRTAKAIDSNIEIIVALTKRSSVDATAKLMLKYQDEPKSRFWEEPNATEYKADYMDELGQFIHGHYKDYDFEVRAYKWTGEVLEELSLYSSEVEMNRALAEAGLSIENLPKEAMYYLKKLEYSLRLANKEKYKEKIPYLIEKIRATYQVEELSQ